MSGTYPERYVVFDTESRRSASTRRKWDHDQTLRLGVAKVIDPVVYPGGFPLYARFSTRDEFDEVLQQLPMEKRPIYVFAHNMMYDLRIISWFELVAMGRYSIMPPQGIPGAARYHTPLLVLDGSSVMARFFRQDGQRFIFVDSFNWLRKSLAKIGEEIGFPKGRMPSEDQPEEDWYTYCQRDVDVLDAALRKLWGWLGCLRLPGWSLTPASQAAAVYRMRYARGRIERPDDVGSLRIDRLGYHGGQCEVLRLGVYDRQSYYVDVNSLYPHVMKHNAYPCKLIESGIGCDPAGLRDRTGATGCTAEVYLDSPDTPYPVRGKDRSLWVTGRVRTVLCGPELDGAIDAGHVVKVGRWNRYKLEMLFDGYVDLFWRLRQRAIGRKDPLIGDVCKLILNSLHGKFGQREGEWQHCGRTETPGVYSAGKLLDPRIGRAVDVRVMDGHFFINNRDGEHKEGFVPIAAWTTAYARIYMDQLIRAAGANNTLMLAVDALLLTQDGYDTLSHAGLIDTGRLGDMKTVGSFKWVDVQNVNQWDHDSGFRHSGIPRDATRTEIGAYEFEEWETGAHAIFGGDVSVVSTRTTLRRPGGRYTRRRVTKDGITVPWRMENWGVPPEDQLLRRIDHGD